MQGSIDSPIVDLVEYINKQAGLFTLSSCMLVLTTSAGWVTRLAKIPEANPQRKCAVLGL